MEGGGGEQVLLPGLGGGVIDFKDAEDGRAIAEGEGIEAGAEQDILRRAAGNGGGEGVFREPRASDEEGAEGVGVRAIRAGGGSLQLLGVDGTEDGNGEGVGEDEGVGVDQLMGGATEGDAEGGAGWGGQVQGLRDGSRRRGNRTSCVYFDRIGRAKLPEARGPMRKPLVARVFVCLAASLCLVCGLTLHAQDDGGFTPTDGGGGGVLESIYVPNLPHAPFSLTLHTEWIQTLRNGGTFTEINARPIMRDGAGRIYQERWLLVPKGSDIRSQMTTIQIDDPIAHKFYNCFVRQKVCEIQTSVMGLAHYDPNRLQSGPLKSGKGAFLHEDLGASSAAGMPVHTYRDTTTLNTGVLGNDAPMAIVREFSYSPDLGFDLTSSLDSPQVGHQTFTVTELNTNEPDPSFFQPPEGYRLVDRRKPQTGTSAQ